MFQTEAQQATPECQQLVLVKREVLRRIKGQENALYVLLCLSGEASSVHTKPFVCFADVRRCKLHMAGDLQLNSSYRAPQPIHQRQIDGPVMDGPWSRWLLWVHNLTQIYLRLQAPAFLDVNRLMELESNSRNIYPNRQ